MAESAWSQNKEKHLLDFWLWSLDSMATIIAKALQVC